MINRWKKNEKRSEFIHIECVPGCVQDRMASRILGMGDIVSMVEKAKKVTPPTAALSCQLHLTECIH